MHPQVIVIGGGVIGAASAYFLARRGAQVLLIERKHMGSGASGVTASMIGLSSGITAPLKPHAVEGHRRIPTLEAETGVDLEIVRGGGLSLASNDNEIDMLRAQQTADLEEGIEGRLIDAAELRTMAPWVAHHLCAALHRPHNYHVNPFRLYEAYTKGAVDKGAKVTYAEVRDIRFTGGRIDRVVTNKGDHLCETVVVACGAYTAQLLARVGIDVPIVPGRGQAIITEACQPVTPYMVNCPGHLYTRQVLRGNFYIGSETEFVGFDRNITLEKISKYTCQLVKTIPMLARLRAIRFFSGFRPMPKDELPIVGPLSQCARLIVAAGHARGGMLYSAGTGLAVSGLVMDGKSEIPIGAFSPDRFAKEASG